MGLFHHHEGPGLADDWREQASGLVTWFDALVDDEQVRIGELAGRLLTEKRWEAANGFELTEEIRLTISLQAALLVLGLSFEHYREVGAIIVHPSTLVLAGERGVGGGMASDDPLSLLGLAGHAEGPVVIVWDEARRNARHPERGHDVVFHEFAHKLDMLDHTVDGTPPLESQASHDRWVQACTEVFQAVRRGEGPTALDDYAGQDVGEFFAVATEAFFDRPTKLRHQAPELYAVLADFYRQDPASLPDA
jgi:Mlc titration factor MtfA (ptsG expression regulator)